MSSLLKNIDKTLLKEYLPFWRLRFKGLAHGPWELKLPSKKWMDGWIINDKARGDEDNG